VQRNGFENCDHVAVVWVVKMGLIEVVAAVICALAKLQADMMQHEQKYEQWVTWLVGVLMPEWWEI
jgi:threonine/homoserine/homoserine lactone efflux protein